MWRRRIAFGAIGALALPASFTAQNFETISGFAPFVGDNGTIPNIIDCPEIGDDSLSVPVTGVDDVRSTVTNFDSAGIRPFETLEIITSFFDYPQESFVSNKSRLKFVFYSDVESASWTIDHEAFDELFHFALNSSHEFSHPAVEKSMQCLRQRIIKDKEFAGEEYSIYIPNNPRTCLGNGRIIDLTNQPDAECHQRGFAPPKIDVSVFGLWSFEGRIMILTGGRNDKNTQSSMQRLAFHESIHALTALPGEVDFQYNPNERWVKYIERTLRREESEEYNKIKPFVSFEDKVVSPLAVEEK